MIVILLLITAIVLFVLHIFNKKNNQQEVDLPDLQEQTSNTQNLPETQKQPAVNPIQTELSEEEKERGFLIKTSSAFAERYGSYSNQSNYENLIDLKYFMSARMQQIVDSKITVRNLNKTDVIYYGVTTRAISAEIQQINFSQATVKVKTQREEFYGADVNSKVSYQDILISFIKQDGVWKVDSVEWQ